MKKIEIPVAELKLRRNSFAEFSFSSRIFMLLLQRLMHINTYAKYIFVKESNTINLCLSLPHFRHGWKLLAKFSLVSFYYICDIFILFLLPGLDNRALKLAVYID